MVERRPRAITGSAGSRIKVLLGDEGSDYFVLTNQDDGDNEYQSKAWTISSGGMPSSLANQINNCSAKGRHVTDVAFGPNGEWYVAGKKRDGSGKHSWSGGTSACFEEPPRGEDQVQVTFGNDWTHIVVLGSNGYQCSGGIDGDLVKRMKRVNKHNKEIKCVRLLPDGGYIISDSEGTEWKNLEGPLQRELKNGGKDPILDVAVAGDGAWIVVRPNKFTASKSVNSAIKLKLSQFYQTHQSRQKLRCNAIKAYDTRVQQGKERREKEQREAAERAAKEEEARRLEAERLAKQEEEMKNRRAENERAIAKQEQETKNRRDENERKNEIRRKGLRIGDRVTAIGISHEPGDALVHSFGGDGSLVLKHVVPIKNGRSLKSVGKSSYESMIIVLDLRMLSLFDEQEEDPDAILLLCTAKDKYEAAVSVFHCHCHDGICKCTKVLSADIFLPSNIDPQQVWEIGQRVLVDGFTGAVILDPEARRGGKNNIKIKYDNGSTFHVLPNQLKAAHALPNQLMAAAASEPAFPLRPVLEHRGEVEKFDEYKCAEKIDLRRLERILADLRTDRDSRDALIERLDEIQTNTSPKQFMILLKQMQRCKVLEVTAMAMYGLLKDLVRDNSGCVVHEVEYEHRDPSYRGRLFAIGQQVKIVFNDKYPRTATLQGMHSDLRAPLVGEFAHDIDCENSEVRLVCSLATQLDLKELIPILFDYCENRQKWLARIADLHNVTHADAKRLPNIILSGGRYETWMRNMGLKLAAVTPSPLGQEVKSFVFKLYSQIHAFRDQVLHHPRFKWTSIDREKLRQDGISDAAINNKIMPRIVQCCENEVLSIMHRSFFDRGWLVRAKVFDGLIAECDRHGSSSIGWAMRAAEEACHARGWDIRLSEKPLHGKQDEPIQTIVESRMAMEELKNQCKMRY